MLRSQSHRLDAAIDRLAIVSDIHAHRPPLEAIDRLLAAEGGRAQVLFNGDLFYGGPRPAEAADWVIARAGPLATIGNHDEGMLAAEEAGDEPPFTEAGARQRLTDEQIAYFRSLPERLDVQWRGKRIVLMHGHHTPDGEARPFLSTPGRQIDDFLDPTAELCTTGHTHYAFRRRVGAAWYANSGSTSLTILAARVADGLHVQSGESELAPDADPGPSFLSVTEADGALDVRIVRFEYDREAMLADLHDAGYPHVEGVRRWLATGILG